MTQLVITGQVVDQPEDRAAPGRLVEQQRSAKAQQELPGDRDDRVADASSQSARQNIGSPSARV